MNAYKSFQCSLFNYNDILYPTLYAAGCHKMCSSCNLRRSNRFVMLWDISRAPVAIILRHLPQLIIYHYALPSFQITPAAFVFHDVGYHHAVPLLPASQGAALLFRKDHCNLVVVVPLNKGQKNKTYCLCFFRLDYQLPILCMPISHQISYRILASHNTLII